MKFALVNPPWSYKGSIYFGCREPHLPVEFGYAEALLRQAGHEAVIIDGHLFQLSPAEIAGCLREFQPDHIVVATAPTYLFWRCPPPELRVPAELIRALGAQAARVIAVGPHGSATPRAALTKLGVQAVIRGEFEEVLPRLAAGEGGQIPGLWRATAGVLPEECRPQTANLENLPPLLWSGEWLRRHFHHHHRFETRPTGPGAEMETSRGCPFHCSFCARDNFRGAYRKRPLAITLIELDHLLTQGVEYLYFIDEIFLPDRPLLEELLARPLKFGIQTRIDLWSREMIELLGAAGCVSMEAGIESITAEGRRGLNKPGLLAGGELTDLLIFAKRHIAFVQANLVRTIEDDVRQVTAWRARLQQAGVWTNDPVPLFFYPGSPAYRQRWGEPDDLAWERAHAHYLGSHAALCELQESEPLPLPELELAGGEYG
jgi:anaerobic magnesium-protoporphyrin IX monomethyl ester cyclase